MINVNVPSRSIIVPVEGEHHNYAIQRSTNLHYMQTLGPLKLNGLHLYCIFLAPSRYPKALYDGPSFAHLFTRSYTS